MPTYVRPANRPNFGTIRRSRGTLVRSALRICPIVIPSYRDAHLDARATVYAGQQTTG